MVEVNVELRPHKGIQQTPLGPVEVTHAQMLVLASVGSNPLRHVAYVGTQPNAPFNGLPQFTDLPAEYQEAIVAKTTAMMASGEHAVSTPLVADFSDVT